MLQPHIDITKLATFSASVDKSNFGNWGINPYPHGYAFAPGTEYIYESGPYRRS